MLALNGLKGGSRMYLRLINQLYFSFMVYNLDWVKF